MTDGEGHGPGWRQAPDCDRVPRNSPLQVRETASRQRNVRDQGLVPSEQEIARRLSQELGTWRATAAVLERHGLPRIDPIMGGRYWPAVFAWWNRRYGLATMEASPPDGEEDLNAL